jgi:hypothetical protein
MSKAAGTKPDAALKQYVGRDPTWIEVELPHDLYDADWNTEGGLSPKAVDRASEYARRLGRLPPGMAAYGGRRAVRSIPKVFVTDGNHRAYAAFLRGDSTARFYMPLREWERFREVIGE